MKKSSLSAKILSAITLAFLLFILTSFFFIGLKENKAQEEERQRCTLEPDEGFCKAFVRKYYFDQNENTCKEFIWGGCGGIVPFETREDCQAACENNFQNLPDN